MIKINKILMKILFHSKKQNIHDHCNENRDIINIFFKINIILGGKYFINTNI